MTNVTVTLTEKQWILIDHELHHRQKNILRTKQRPSTKVMHVNEINQVRRTIHEALGESQEAGSEAGSVREESDG